MKCPLNAQAVQTHVICLCILVGNIRITSLAAMHGALGMAGKWGIQPPRDTHRAGHWGPPQAGCSQLVTEPLCRPPRPAGHLVWGWLGAVHCPLGDLWLACCAQARCVLCSKWKWSGAGLSCPPPPPRPSLFPLSSCTEVPLSGFLSRRPHNNPIQVKKVPKQCPWTMHTTSTTHIADHKHQGVQTRDDAAWSPRWWPKLDVPAWRGLV